MKQAQNQCFIVSLAVFLFIGFILPVGIIHAAEIYLSPLTDEIFIGDILKVDVFLDTEDEILNSGEIILEYSQEYITPIDVSHGSSIFKLWIEEPSYTNNTINFKGGKPNGFIDNYALIGSVLFTALKNGTTTIDLHPSARVLKHDGLGTIVKLRLASTLYTIVDLPDNLTNLKSSSHPKSGKWYPKRTFRVSWEVEPRAKYSYLMTQDITAKPDEIANQPIGDIKITDLTDGTWYFTLRQKLPDEINWSRAQRFVVSNDLTPPHSLTAKISQSDRAFKGAYFLSFSALDSVSGVAYYEVKEGDGNFIKATSPYLLNNQSRNEPVYVRAVDKAGNGIETSIPAIPKPFLTPLILLIISLIFFTVIFFTVIIVLRNKH